MVGDLLTALALVLVIEGAAYALFPQGMQRMMAMVSQLPPYELRRAGILAALAGFVLVWAVRG